MKRHAITRRNPDLKRPVISVWLNDGPPLARLQPRLRGDDHKFVREIRGFQNDLPPDKEKRLKALKRDYRLPEDEVDTEFDKPDMEFTRIWMAAVNAEGDYPPYACIVGEVYDSDPRQKDRPRVLLDEATGFDSDDFTQEECKRWNLDPRDTEYPTLFTLSRAMVGLKDIWWPEFCWVPPDPKTGFTMFCRRIDGLMMYDKERRTGDVDPMSWFPCHRTKHRTTPVVEVPAEDRLTNLRIVNSLFHRDLLMVYDCPIWEQYRSDEESTPNRAIGLVLERMQLFDMTYEIRRWELSDGYEEPEDKEDSGDLTVRDVMEEMFG